MTWYGSSLLPTSCPVSWSASPAIEGSMAHSIAAPRWHSKKWMSITTVPTPTVLTNQFKRQRRTRLQQPRKKSRRAADRERSVGRRTVGQTCKQLRPPKRYFILHHHNRNDAFLASTKHQQLIQPVHPQPKHAPLLEAHLAVD